MRPSTAQGKRSTCQFEVALVNARHIKQVPGRKSDVKDCQCIAKLLQTDLLRASFVPPRSLRELRDPTGHRTKLTPARAAAVNRFQAALTPKADRWLTGALGEAAWAASRTKNTYLSVLFRRIAARRRNERAVVAVGHAILAVISTPSVSLATVEARA